jgi:RNA polymerase sigma-70 factor (ECF subfamily)
MRAGAAIESAFRAASGRIVGALAARYRDLDLAEEAFAEACARAVARWREDGIPGNPAGWLYRAAERAALDALRRNRVRARHAGDPVAETETVVNDESILIPDERLRLIFVCCHPAMAPDARAALTLRLVCGLSTAEIAGAFLLPEPTLAQRLVRAKRKIAEAGVPFEIPGPRQWRERLEAVLSTLEIAYAKAHEDAAGAGAHAGYAAEMLGLSGVLAELLPEEPEALAFAALVRFAEARRPARLDGKGRMVPLSEQDPALWRREPIAEATDYLRRAAAFGPTIRGLHAAIHGAWCGRRSLAEPPPWPEVLALYDRLLALRDDPIVRLNRAVALAEVSGVAAGLAELERLPAQRLDGFLPWHAVRADLLRRAGRDAEAAAAYDSALALNPGVAEAAWLEKRRSALQSPAVIPAKGGIPLGR